MACRRLKSTHERCTCQRKGTIAKQSAETELLVQKETAVDSRVWGTCWTTCGVFRVACDPSTVPPDAVQFALGPNSPLSSKEATAFGFALGGYATKVARGVSIPSSAIIGSAGYAGCLEPHFTAPSLLPSLPSSQPRCTIARAPAKMAAPRSTQGSDKTPSLLRFYENVANVRNICRLHHGAYRSSCVV